MIEFTVTFDKNWLTEQRKAGKRVVRFLEKWSAGREGVKLITSSGTEMTFRMDVSIWMSFIKEISQVIGAEFGVREPATVFSCSKPKRIREASEADDSEEAPETKAPRSHEQPKGIKEAGKRQAEPVPQKEPAAPTPEEVLADVLSRVPFKHHAVLRDHLTETAQVIPILRQMDALGSFWRQGLLVSIDDGYGMTDFLKGLADLYAAHGLLRPGVGKKAVRELKVGNTMDLSGNYPDWDKALETVQILKHSNEGELSTCGILCLDVGAWQGRLASSEAKSRLRRLNASSGNFTIVFRVPFVEPRALRSTEEALGDIFNIRSLAVPPVGLSGLFDHARDELAKRSFRLCDDAQEAFEQCVLEEKRDDSFFGYRTVDKMVDRMIYGKARENGRTGQLDRDIHGVDIAPRSVSDAEGDPRAELEGLIGLGEVKAKMFEIVEQIKMQRKLAGKGRRVKRPAIHMLFTGSPGTGKTTVARIVARLLKQEGVLRKGHLLEVKGRDLCGEYVGQTAPKTSSICRDAYGSVLFIDEAYSLFRGDDRGRDFGQEALDTLIAEMENHRDDLCVIMAGYTSEMETMLGGNSGLLSRIPYAVNFPNYSREELVRIFFAMAEGNFGHEKALEKALRDYFAQIPDEVMAGRDFSNARFVRNLYERTWGKAVCRNRLGGDGEVKLLASDLAGAAGEREFREMLERTARKPIGFGV